MVDAWPPAGDLATAIREATPAALGVLVRQGTAFADAEDAVQEALVLAWQAWPVTGVPDRPVGWLVRVAQRREIARHRTDSARQRRESLVAAWSARPREPVTHDDDPLGLLFLCSHPDLSPAAAIPLTLRAVGGLTTREIAAALLASEATIAQRISRAKATIARSGSSFVAPPPDLVDERLPSVLQVIYLIFTEAHVATAGAHLDRPDLAAEAVRLARQVHARLPAHPEAAGLLALLLLTDARRAARTDAAGDLVPLDRQDRATWDRSRISEGLRVLTAAMAHHRLGEYQIQAAIAAVHDQAPRYDQTDWPTVLALYDLLVARRDNPLVHLSRAVALAHTSGPAAALGSLEPVAASLAGHHRYHATLAHLHEMAGDLATARRAYATAAALATNDAERRHLAARAGTPPA